MAQSKQVFQLRADEVGGGPIVCAWHPNDSLLALVGANRVLNILDRQGKKQAEMPLSEMGEVLDIHWDMDGECLAILQQGLQFAIVWNYQTRSYTQIDVGQGDRACFIRWSYKEPVLAIGSQNGALTYFNKGTQRKIPTVGKHSGPVIAGDWDHGQLITSSTDRTLTLSLPNGDTKAQSTKLNAEPRQLAWSRGSPNQVITVLDGMTMLVYDYTLTLDPKEIAFQPNYGRIVHYEQYEQDKIVIGFSQGYLVQISKNQADIGRELNSLRLFNTSLDTITICESLGKAAVAGENTIRIIQLHNFKESKSEKIDLPFDAGRVLEMHWTNDGQILNIQTGAGHVYNYLMVVPSLSSVNKTMVCILTSLNEATIIETNNGIRAACKVQLEIEPMQVSLGDFHLAVSVYT